MTYTIEQHFGGYNVIDDEDGERVARVTKFMPGPVVSCDGATLTPPALARAIARAMVLVADEIDGGADARFIDELPVKQIKAAAEWLSDDPGHDPRARFYRLQDGSIDVHQSDAHANIEPDGRNNG